MTVLDRVRDVARSIFAALAVTCLLVAFLVSQAGSGRGRLALGAAAIGILSLAIAAGPRALLQLFGARRGGEDGDREHGDQSTDDWWLANLESALDGVWDTQADYLLASGLAVVGVGSLVAVATYPGEDAPVQLLAVGLVSLNGALIVLAAATIDSTA